MEPSTIARLAARISANSSVIDEHLRSHNLPTPSFDRDGPAEVLNPDQSEKVRLAREAVLDDTRQLYGLVLGPSDYWRILMLEYMDGAVIRIIYHFGIPQAVPLDGGASYAGIASKTGLPERLLRSTLRQSATNKIFAESKPDHVVHTARSAVLVRNPLLMDLLGHISDEAYPASAKFVEALERYGQSGLPNQSPFSIAHNTSGSAFDYYNENKEAQTRFAHAMEGFSSYDGFDTRHIINGYDWKAAGEATVVDVGGSAGHVSIALARAFPALKFIVQDLSHTAAHGASNVPAELRERIRFMQHDFFTEQPVQADIYLLRHVLHDWPESFAVKVLQNLVPALRNGSKILLVEVVVDQPGQSEPLQERIVRAVDMHMFNMLQAQERSVQDWEKVVAKADPRLELTGFRRAPGSVDSLIEITFTAGTEQARE